MWFAQMLLNLDFKRLRTRPVSQEIPCLGKIAKIANGSRAARPVVLSLRGCRSPGVARHTGMPRRKDHGPPRRVVLWAFEFHCTARDPLRCRQCAIFFYKKILHLQSQLLLCLLSKKKLQSILLEWHFKSCLKARLHRFKITIYFAQHSATEVQAELLRAGN